MVTSIDTSLLLGIYNTRAGMTGGVGLGAGSSSTRAKVAPTAPWTNPPTAAEASAAVKAALAGRKLVNENAAQLDLPGASTDYRKLFALYQGLSTLNGIVEQIQKKGLTSIEKTRLQSTFAKGLEEVMAYSKAADLDKVRLTSGEVGTTTKTTVPVQANKQEYTTAPIFAGTSSEAVPQFAGDVKFSIAVKRSGVTYNVDVDLNELGTQTRSMANVVNFINGKLQAAGVDTRFATQRLPGAERTITAGGQTIKLGPGPDQWALKIKPGGETVSFSAVDTAPAVYMTQGVGDPNPDGKVDTNDGVITQQLLKFQTDTTNVDAPVAGQNDANWVDGRAFAKTLGSEVKAVRATKIGPDGSVYMLADITNKTAGQEIKGAQDVALLKYDPAGNLVYTRTLGASDTASGLGLTVAADGRVAIAGSIVGGLNGAQEGPMNSGPTGAFAKETDSFVTVFNAEGEEMWTQRRGARLADEASQIVFGDNNMVYVAGRSKSALPGAAGLGDWDSYIEGFGPPSTNPLTKGKVPATFTQSFGTSGADRPAGMVLDGTNLITASVENGRGVLRRFDISSGSPVLTSTRDLGDLQGGEIVGLALDGGDVVVAGSTSNGALAAGATTRAHSGGSDAFAARISKDLSPGGSIAYYGGAGDDRATSLSVSNGQVFVAGSVGSTLPGEDGQPDLAAVGKKDGFLAQLDVAAGSVEWARRFTGKDGYTAPGAIAVDATGASSLDRLGLPKGTLDMTDSQRITAASSIRAGDQFTVRAGTGRAQTITIDAEDTLATLATKIKRATGFQAKVAVTNSGGVRKLTVTPLNGRTILEFGAGKVGKDALEFLGIPEGIVRNTIVNDKGVSEPADGKGQIFGLGLEADLRLDSAVEIAHAAADISTAMGVIRKAYKDLVAQATPQSNLPAASTVASGPVPQYLTDQIANYQAALTRLGG
ncbi:MAG: hypothetical protein EPO51_03950 [Phenylobacterium sp.]|uniref:hypothetical protein n=1 Tax=Phenylobacterium sp. TaxID=1871053 RepID=UPI001222A577|nr:hypothetical protein [Phenylobacterium sp.]TAJ73991.1 MAG: hypothetical protein EPO51_03950 [Phenylobacterium sp.]